MSKFSILLVKIMQYSKKDYKFLYGCCTSTTQKNHRISGLYIIILAYLVWWSSQNKIGVTYKLNTRNLQKEHVKHKTKEKRLDEKHRKLRKIHTFFEWPVKVDKICPDARSKRTAVVSIPPVAMTSWLSISTQCNDFPEQKTTSSDE